MAFKESPNPTAMVGFYLKNNLDHQMRIDPNNRFENKELS